MRRKTSIVTKLILISILVIFVVALFRSNKQSAPSVPIGQNGRLYSSGGSAVPVGISDVALEKFYSSQHAKDQIGMQQMIASGSVMVIDNGTKVLVVEHGSMFVRKIRILDGKLKGMAGYTSADFIRPL